MSEQSFLNKLVMNFSSSERLTGSGSSSDFLLNPNLNNFSGVKSVGLLSVEIPNSVYNVDSKSNNFKLRLLKIRNTNIDYQNLAAPESFLIDFNIPSKNYSVQKLTETLDAYTGNWLSANAPGKFNVSPLLYSVDLDSYKFSVRLNPALSDFNQWGFYIPSCTLGRVLGFINLKDDSSYLNINSSNCNLGAAVFSNNPGQSGEYKLTENITITEDNKVLSFLCKKTSAPNGTYHFLINLDLGTYTPNQLCSLVNAKIISLELGMFGVNISYPAVINGYQVFETIGNDGSIRLIYTNGFKFVNNNGQTNNITMKFLPESSKFLDLLCTTLNGDRIDDFTSSVYNTYTNEKLGNILGFLLNTVYVTIPQGYYTYLAFVDSLPHILKALFISASNDWSTKNVSINVSTGLIESTLGTAPNYNKICFAETNEYQGYKLFNVSPVHLLDRKQRIVENPNINVNLNFSIGLPSISVFNNLVGNVIIDLRGGDILYLHSTIQQNPNVNGFGDNQRVLAKVPMAAPLGSTVFWVNYDHEMYRYPCSLVNMISFQLKNKFGEIVDLGGLDWSGTLVFYFDA